MFKHRFENITGSESSTLSENSKGIAELVNHVRLNSFTRILTAYLYRFCRYDDITMLANSPGSEVALIYPLEAQYHTPLLRKYCAREYLQDPSLNPAIVDDRTVFRYADLLTDAASGSHFYNGYYRYLEYSDEVLMQIPVANNVRILISMGRRNALGEVTRQELQRLHAVYPIIEALVQQFWISQGESFSQRQPEEGPLENALRSFGNGILTKREREVSELILKGYSTKCIARDLDISVGTVKVHRKNIHSRMKTSTQSDLFKEFLSYLDGLISQTA